VLPNSVVVEVAASPSGHQPPDCSDAEPSMSGELTARWPYSARPSGDAARAGEPGDVGGHDPNELCEGGDGLEVAERGDCSALLLLEQWGLLHVEVGEHAETLLSKALDLLGGEVERGRRVLRLAGGPSSVGVTISLGAISTIADPVRMVDVMRSISAPLVALRIESR